MRPLVSLGILFLLPLLGSAQQSKEPHQVTQSRQQAVSLAQNRALEGCYSTAADLGASLYQAQERIAQLESELRAAKEKPKEAPQEEKTE